MDYSRQKQNEAKWKLGINLAHSTWCSCGDWFGHLTCIYYRSGESSTAVQAKNKTPETCLGGGGEGGVYQGGGAGGGEDGGEDATIPDAALEDAEQ
ncbi:ORF2 [Torque teno indri virus 1]|uniref:ORF2 n=1 Tax=Torque teno indri virus 1 TaxID=2010248 RepID=A0A1Z1W0S4_9VIRU|nr:ORF2 [Torque teno indri virus 1]ARX79663.1 ORF2 [Torque teno indri virus 1]